MSNLPRLPNNSQRLAIVGRTGSGKTQAALWHLSTRDFDKKPWVIFDFKLDDHIAQIEGAEEIDFDTVPKKAGIYVLHPHPSQQEEVNEYLWKLWSKENVGIFADEGYMIPNPRTKNAFQACLTQGRSKKIPMIVLSQRPNWISRFVFSEADFFQIFQLTDNDDTRIVQRYIHADDKNISIRLPDYHSYYFDVGKNKIHTFGPVPDEAIILETINEKLLPLRKRQRI
jgi:hypothetical protein